MGFGMIGMSLFWILLIVAVVAVVKNLWTEGSTTRRHQQSTALDILKERYARGEIDKDDIVVAVSNDRQKALVCANPHRFLRKIWDSLGVPNALLPEFT